MYIYIYIYIYEAIFGPAAYGEAQTARSSVRSASTGRSVVPENSKWELHSLLTELCVILCD